MELKDYPLAIAKLQKQVLSLDYEIQTYQLYIKEAESEIESIIAFDSNLRNDAQRKAKRQELLDEREDYKEWRQSLSTVSANREEIFIDLCLRRNEFSILKLEKREAIAQMEMQTAS